MKLKTGFISAALILLLTAFILSCGGGGDNGSGPGGGPSKEDLPSISTSLGTTTAGTAKQTATFTISSTHSWSSSVSQDGSWCSISPTSGAAGQTKVTLSVAENETASERKAEITFTASGATAKTVVTQTGKTISQGGEDMNPKNDNF